jgi:hypothetical protein
MKQTKYPAKIFWETTISSERNPTLSTEYNHIETVHRAGSQAGAPRTVPAARHAVCAGRPNSGCQSAGHYSSVAKDGCSWQEFYLKMVTGNLCRPQKAIIPASRHFEEPCLEWKPGVDEAKYIRAFSQSGNCVYIGTLERVQSAQEILANLEVGEASPSARCIRVTVIIVRPQWARNA